MSKLIEYSSTSSIMDIKIKLNDKVYSFNLDKELKISESRVGVHLMNQARSYAFVAMLHKKLIIKARDQQREISRAKDSAVSKWAETMQITAAKAKAANDLKVKKLENDLMQIEEARDTIEVCVRSFEMRKDLIQTLSANIRKEKIN